MLLLDAVNIMLPKLGERPVTSLEVRHPTLAVLLPIIEQNLKQNLQRGWWFNKYPYTAYPDTEGEITLGTTTLSFVSDQANVASRGLRLFNTGTHSYVFTAPVSGVLIEHVAFDELPESAATFILYSSLVEAYTTDLGITQELQVWQALSGQAWSNLLTEHLRNCKYSTRKSRRWRALVHSMQG